MLERIADFYEDDVDRTVDRLKSLIEPLMIVILAGSSWNDCNGDNGANV